MKDAYEVHNPEIERTLKDVGRAIARDLPDGWGFTLFIFSLGAGGSTFYLSNAQRADMLEALQEFIDRNKRLQG